MTFDPGSQPIPPNMQRWFFLEDPNNENIRSGADKDKLSLASISNGLYDPRKWLFRIRVPDLNRNEVVCVSGSCPQLGNWMPERVVPLVQEDEDSDIWSAEIFIPDNTSIYYRYCVCMVIEQSIQVIVKTWEANLKPRCVEKVATCPKIQDEPDFYGQYDGFEMVDRGWLCKETIIQLKLCNNPLTLFRSKYKNRTIFIKVTPVSLQRLNSNFPINMSDALEESLSTETQDNLESPKHSFTQVASLTADDPSFKLQAQFGHEYNENDMLIFQTTVLFPTNIAYLVDLYIYSSNSSDGDPPYHAGFSYLLPSALQNSEGRIILPVTSTKQRPLGQLNLDYLIIGPLPNFKCTMQVTYEKHWKKNRPSLDVGHRGSGSSFKTETKNCAEVRENTIASLKNAIDHGADFVEFDVQLSKDLVPIIYHDFHVCISMRKKKELDDTDMLEIPLKDLTLDQLRLLKVYHLTEAKTKNPRFFDEDLEEHQPFPTLKHALETLDTHTGFNIEVKWTMQMNDGTFELYHPTDLNLYMDTILEIVLRYGGTRRIIFSCFNPDVCQMLRLKQNKYPVMFLTIGESKHYAKYSDPRCWSIKHAAQFANMSEILGINVHTEDILRDPSLVQYATRSGLVIFCWGDDNADPATIKYLKELGLNGVIFDKIYQYSSKEVKESIFLVEARESQKQLMQVAAATAEAPNSPPAQPILRERVLDVERARINMVDNLSTATTLESLESSLSDNKSNK